jgi:hypothetical protein
VAWRRLPEVRGSGLFVAPPEPWKSALVSLALLQPVALGSAFVATLAAEAPPGFVVALVLVVAIVPLTAGLLGRPGPVGAQTATCTSCGTRVPFEEPVALLPLARRHCPSCWRTRWLELDRPLLGSSLAALLVAWSACLLGAGILARGERIVTLEDGLLLSRGARFGNATAASLPLFGAGAAVLAAAVAVLLVHRGRARRGPAPS